jgi:hypothetical protein
MIGVLFAILILCYVGLPIIFLIYFWRSRYCSCPYCGENILKSEKTCPNCSKKMPKYDTLEQKVIKVSKSYQYGAEILATPESKLPEMFERRKKNRSE